MAGLALIGLVSCAQPPRPGVWTNSLGMEMVVVPVADGLTLRMACVETQERHLAPFRRSLGQAAASSARPAAWVSWTEARAFCEWLTQQERLAGVIGPGQRYRLPTDHEWSCAVGLGGREKVADSIEAKSGRYPGCYPWGEQWPPPPGAGNLCGEESRRDFPDLCLTGYRDRLGGGRLAARASSANDLGLYDLSGSLWEWCEDRYREGTDWRVLRGGSWKSSRRQTLQSSHRTHDPEAYRSDSVGFRCVLEGESPVSNGLSRRVLQP
jgi:formylglycine-generating enzyme required for sulfatase activity